ncbi:MAG: YodL domain-containing protein [Faecousia sp.]
MASLRDTVREYQDDLRSGIAWLAFWREGRSWHGEAFHLDMSDYLYPEDKMRLAEIQATDPKAVVVNGYYSGYLGEEMSMDELAAGVRHHYENGLSNIAPFMEAHDDVLPPEVLEEARAKAHEAGLPFYERPYNGEDIDPYVYDGNMSIEDYELMHRLMEQDNERSERVNEVFSIQLHNRQLYEQGKDGVWLDMPTTTEQLQAALRQIGISADNPQDFFINGYSYPEGQHLALPYDMVLAADVDELNFLAARLGQLDAAEIAELNAALQNPKGGFASIGQIIDFTENADYYVHLPDVHTAAALGDYYLNRSGMVDMPQEWKAGIDTAQFGRYIAQQEQGAFTEYGYIVKSGDEWQRVHEGQPVPEEYRVMAFPQPEVMRDEIKTRQAAVLTVEAPQSQSVIPIDLNGKNNAERMKEITDRLEAGIQALFESEQYKAYLTAMSKFHNYSFNNTLLIAMQKPDASLVAGFGKWRDDFERHVKKGEKGIKILAPSPYKVKKQMEKIDPSTQKPVIGADGKPVTEEREIEIPAFRVVTVFDVSQTEGKEIPDIAVSELTGSVEQYQDFFAALEKASPVPIAFENIEGGAHGYYHLEEKRIAIDEGMSELQTLKTAIHEIAHAKLHAIDKGAPATEQADRLDRRTREVQAESVAYAVCQHYGLDTSDYSFGYVAGWSSGRELSELKASLETIRKAANELITNIDGHLAQLRQEREAKQEAEQPQEQEAAYRLENGNTLYVQTSETGYDYTLYGPDNKELDGGQLDNPDLSMLAARDEILSVLEQETAVTEALTGDKLEAFQEAAEQANAIPTPAQETETPALDPAAEPVVTVLWSESPHLKEGQTMPLHEADALFARLDTEFQEPGYDKTKFRIDFTFRGQPDNYEGRQDFGDGDGSLIQHIQSYHEYYAQDESWKNHVIAETGLEGWEQDKAERDMLLGEFVPYMKLHCNLSQMEQEAGRALRSGEELTPEQQTYFHAVLDYVQECRPLLNQGQYQLPEPPKLSDFDQTLQDYKEQVQVEIAQEAAAAGMTVEEYAAAGYESPEQDSFSIYQIKSGDETRDYRFEPYDRLQATGRSVDRANYDLVYTAPLDGKTTLEDIYRTFNIDHPADFKGHSLSVSDVVVLHQGGKDTAHYCDSFGFQQVPEFLRENPLRTAELSTEQNENMIDGVINNTPSMGELEAKVKAGEQISLTNLADAANAEAKKPKAKQSHKTQQKKPSIRAQLKAAQEEQAKKKPAREKSQELEV